MLGEGLWKNCPISASLPPIFETIDTIAVFLAEGIVVVTETIAKETDKLHRWLKRRYRPDY